MYISRKEILQVDISELVMIQLIRTVQWADNLMSTTSHFTE